MFTHEGDVNTSSENKKQKLESFSRLLKDLKNAKSHHERHIVLLKHAIKM
jgi:hypothetical protein